MSKHNFCADDFRNEEILKNWIFTGNTSNSYDIYKNKPEEIDIKIILKNTNYTKYLLLKSLKIGLNKHSQIKALSYLTLGNFKTKKIFKSLFPLIIKNLDDLYEFLEFTKSFRGFGSTIVNAVRDWIRKKSFDDLQKEILNYPKNYNWSFSDVLNMISPIPRSNIEKNIFSYCLDDNKQKDVYKKLKIFNCYEEIKKNINVANNIKESQISIKNFPGNIPKTKEIINLLSENMNGKEIIKNINSIDKNILLKNNFMKNKIKESNLNNFFLMSILNDIDDEDVKECMKSVIIKNNKVYFDKKISMFVDTDLEFTTVNKVNGLLYPYFFNNNFNTKYFFKDKITNFENNDIFNLLNIKMINRESSYNTVFIKNILNNCCDEDVIIIWLSNKKIILREYDFNNLKNKKLIIISSNKKTELNETNKNIYLLKGISYKTVDLLKLIIEDVI